MKLDDNIHKKEEIDKIINGLCDIGYNRNIMKSTLKNVSKAKISNVKEDDTIGIAVISHINGISEKRFWNDIKFEQHTNLM